MNLAEELLQLTSKARKDQREEEDLKHQQKTTTRLNELLRDLEPKLRAAAERGQLWFDAMDLEPWEWIKVDVFSLAHPELTKFVRVAQSWARDRGMRATATRDGNLRFEWGPP